MDTAAKKMIEDESGENSFFSEEEKQQRIEPAFMADVNLHDLLETRYEFNDARTDHACQSRTVKPAVRETLSYALGLCIYAIGLFCLAYWVLTEEPFWCLGIALFTIVFGLYVFFNPIKPHGYEKKQKQ